MNVCIINGYFIGKLLEIVRLLAPTIDFFNYGDDKFGRSDKLLVLFKFPNDPEKERFDQWAMRADLIVNQGISAQEFLDQCLLAFHRKFQAEISERERKKQQILEMMNGKPELIRAATQQVLDMKDQPVGMAVDGIRGLTI